MRIVQTMMICSFSVCLLSARVPLGTNTYVERYHAIAVEASMRSGVPASLLLANAIIHTTFGQSVLAYTANNHFNLKWYPSYGGTPFTVEAAGDFGEQPGAYLRFSSAEACYVAYAQAIADHQRFKACFLLEKTDYKAWAMAFAQCLDPSDVYFARRLIQTIETYDLMLYDITDNLALDDEEQPETLSPKNSTPTASNTPRPKFVAHVSEENRPLQNRKKEVSKAVLREENVVYEIVLPPQSRRNATGN